EYKKLRTQIQGVYDEISMLSSKSPNDVVNTFKIHFINSLIQDSNRYLGEKYRPFVDFFEFDLNALPQNSDVVFMLSQYLQCFERFRSDSIIARHGGWYWAVEPEKGDQAEEHGFVYLLTSPPEHLKD
ncbi:MAG: hypothetical protein AAFX40_19230, partial [Cyanobacteria bacterium J06639_1]